MHRRRRPPQRRFELGNLLNGRNPSHWNLLSTLRRRKLRPTSAGLADKPAPAPEPYRITIRLAGADPQPRLKR